MNKLNSIQYRILDRLYFTEPFENLLAEVSEPEPIVADELKTLIMKGYVQVMDYDQENGNWKKSLIYDTDNMRAFSYRATNGGIEQHSQYDK